MAYYLGMSRQPAPVAVPIASYISLNIRLLAICDDCLNVAALDPAGLVHDHGVAFTTADLILAFNPSRGRV